MVLEICVLNQNEVSLCGREAASQRRTLALVAFMLNQLELGCPASGELFELGLCAICRGIVHHDNL